MHVMPNDKIAKYLKLSHNIGGVDDFNFGDMYNQSLYAPII